MNRPSVGQLIWLFAFLILAQTVWLDWRLNKLDKRQPQVLMAEQQAIIDKQLQAVPEPSIATPSPLPAKLWLDPKEASFSGEFTLQILAQVDKSIEKGDIRLFYPPDMLEVYDDAWQVDAKTGTASWSGMVSQYQTLNQLLGEAVKPKGLAAFTIRFKPLKVGTANINFDFTKGSRLDSNLWDSQGNDLLDEAIGGTYEIKSINNLP